MPASRWSGEVKRSSCCKYLIKGLGLTSTLYEIRGGRVRVVRCLKELHNFVYLLYELGHCCKHPDWIAQRRRDHVQEYNKGEMKIKKGGS